MFSPSEQANNYCLRAIEYAKTFNVNLLYSETDIPKIEEILDYYYNDLKGTIIGNITRFLKRERPTDNQIWSMAIIWGSYVGEIIHRYYPNNYEWMIDDSFGNNKGLHLKNNKDTCIYPIDKVYKRLKNGPEDSIISFYDFCKEA